MSNLTTSFPLGVEQGRHAPKNGAYIWQKVINFSLGGGWAASATVSSVVKERW